MKKKDPTENHSQLGNLLERYKRCFTPPQASVEKECITVIKEVCDIGLLPHQVSYTVSTRTIAIKAPSLLRSELRLHHEAILVALGKRLGNKNSPHTII